MKYCPNCGKEVKDGADICLGCGTVINKGNVANTNNSVAGKQSNVVGIIGFVSSLVGLFLWPFVFGTAGIICSAIGISKAKTLQSGKGLSIAGLIVGIVDIVWWIIALIILVAVGSALYY